MGCEAIPICTQDNLSCMNKLHNIEVPGLMSWQHSPWDMQPAKRFSDIALWLQCGSMGLSKGNSHLSLIVDISLYLRILCIQPSLHACPGPLTAFMACFLKDISILLQMECCMESCQTCPMSSLKPATKHHCKSEMTLRCL